MPCTPEGARTPEQGHPLGQARKLEQAARNLECLCVKFCKSRLVM